MSATLDRYLQGLRERKSKLLEAAQLQEEIAVLEAVAAFPGAIECHDHCRVITEIVARRYKLQPVMIKSDYRGAEYALARHIIWYLAHKIGRHGWSVLGRAFHRDHGSIHHGFHRIEDLRSVDRKFNETVAALEADCRVAITAATTNATSATNHEN